MVYDHMKMNNLNLEDVEGKPLLRGSVKGARQKYFLYLEKKMAKL